jgi:hypothetical protein
MGCPWDRRTLAAAKRWNHHEVATWAKGNGCPR